MEVGETVHELPQGGRADSVGAFLALLVLNPKLELMVANVHGSCGIHADL